MPSHDMTAGMTHDADTSEAHEAAIEASGTQAVAADSHEAAAAMMDNARTQDRTDNQAVDNTANQAADNAASQVADNSTGNRVADNTANQVADNANNQVADNTANQATDNTADQNADNVAKADNTTNQFADKTADQNATKQADHDAGVAAPDAPSQTVTELQSEDQVRSSFLNDLREQNEALKGLDDAALERVLSCGDDFQKMRGQLVEELGNVQLEEIAEAMGPDYKFIRGDQIRDQKDRQVTDGMIVREAEDGSLDVAAIAEAKAGRASRRELTASRESFDNLSAKDRGELQSEAIEDFREQFGLASSQDVLKEHGAEIEAMMRDIHGADVGQLSRDFERLMPNAGEDSVTLKIDGMDTDVRVSRSLTDVYAITPNDVSTDRTLENFKEKEPNIRTNSLNLDQTAGEISDLAQKLQQSERQYWSDASQSGGEEHTAQQTQDEAAQATAAQAAQADEQVKAQAAAQAAALQQAFEEAQELQRAEEVAREQARHLRNLEEAEEAFEHA